MFKEISLTQLEREQNTIDFYYKRLVELDNETNFIKKLKEKFPNTKEFNVVSIGFGKYPIEFPALEKFLKEHDLTLKYNGFEINQKKFNCATYRYTQTNVKFHLISGTDHQKISEILHNAPVHIMVLRHPVLNPSRRDVNAPFRDIFTGTVPYLLSEGGCLLTSIYTDREAERARELLPEISNEKLIELTPKSDIFWKTENCSVQYGYSAFINQKNDLYAEKYFFAIPDFAPAFLLNLEKNKIKIDQKKSEQLYNDLHDLIYAKLDVYYLPCQKSARENFIFSKLIEIFAADVVDFSMVSKKIQAELLNKNPKDFESLKNPALDHVTWSFSVWTDNLENQKLMLQRIADAFTLLADSSELTKSPLTKRDSFYLQALNIIAERPLPNELKVPNEAPKDTVIDIKYLQNRW